jgi:hypothetical protein
MPGKQQWVTHQLDTSPSSNNNTITLPDVVWPQSISIHTHHHHCQWARASAKHSHGHYVLHVVYMVSQLLTADVATANQFHAHRGACNNERRL